MGAAAGELQRDRGWHRRNGNLGRASGGATIFAAAVGGSKALGSLTTDGVGTTSAKNVTTVGTISFNDDVTLNGNYDSSAGNGAFTAGKSATLAGNTLINSGSGAVNFNGTLDVNEPLVVQSSGATVFAAPVGATKPLGAATTDGAGTTSAKSVTAVGGISFNDDVTLDGTYDTGAASGTFTAGKSATLAGNTTINTGSGAVTFGGTVNGTAGTETLAVQSSGATVFNDAVGATKVLGALERMQGARRSPRA